MAGKPCLPVSKRRNARDGEPISFGDITSMDASEYLSRVVQQSNRLPEILAKSDNQVPASASKFHNHIPIEGSAASLNYLVSERTEVLSPPSADHVPKHPSEWVDQTLANFSQLREYLEKLHLQKGKTERKQAVPTMKDRPGWHIFCLGLKEARGNAGSYFADDDEEEEQKDGDLQEGKVGESTSNRVVDEERVVSNASDLWRDRKSVV